MNPKTVDSWTAPTVEILHWRSPSNEVPPMKFTVFTMALAIRKRTRPDDSKVRDQPKNLSGHCSPLLIAQWSPGSSPNRLALGSFCRAKKLWFQTDRWIGRDSESIKAEKRLLNRLLSGLFRRLALIEKRAVLIEFQSANFKWNRHKLAIDRIGSRWPVLPFEWAARNETEEYAKRFADLD